MSLLDAIAAVDGFPYDNLQGYKTLRGHDGIALGYVTEAIAKHFVDEPAFSVTDTDITLDAQYDTVDKRNQVFADLGARWRQRELLDALLNQRWRDELYTVFGTDHNVYVLVERALLTLLGVVTYGVHVNGYQKKDGKIYLWVPRRSADRPMWPGLLDNTVAGGLGYPHGVEATLIKEAMEEAGLEEQYVRDHATAAGVVSYCYLAEGNIVQPEVEYIYDLVFDDETKPKPVDGELEDFQLMDVDTVIAKIRQGEFKPNCGLVIIDFLIRHGIVTAENEPNYLEIVQRSHRRMPFPTR